MTSNAASLDLALIGNCAISALVDRRGAIVWCCAPRFDGDPIFHSLLGNGDGAQQDGVFGVELEGFARSEQALRPEHRDRSHAPLRCRGGGHRNRRFLPAFPQPRPLVQAGADRASGAAAGRPPAGSLHRPSARAMGHGSARDHARQQSSALHPAGRRRSAEHQCAPDLRARQHLVLAPGPGEPAARPGRDAVGRDRGNLARFRGDRRRCTGVAGRGAWPCRSSGRTR